MLGTGPAACQLLDLFEGNVAMDIAVIGAGNIGRTLGSAWFRTGHAVSFGVRDASGYSAQQARADLGERARVVSIDEALASASVVVLALPGAAVDEFLASYGSVLPGKVIVDAANRGFGGSGPMNSVDAIRARAGSVPVVRAFNSVGWENLAEPSFDGVVADLLYCSDPAAVATAEELITAVGLRPVCVGDLTQVHLVDMLTGLWAALAYGQGRGRRLAFKVLEQAPGHESP
jgi:predicted dinucleotide-binding enzyme